MRGPVFWSLTLPFLLGAAQDDLPAGWKVYSSKDGYFTVSMPGEPKTKKQNVTTSVAGTLKVVVVIAEGRHYSYFVVSYSDFPLAKLGMGFEDKRLEQACLGAEDKSKGKIREKKSIKLNGRCPRHEVEKLAHAAGIGVLASIQFGGEYPGREIVLEKDGAIIAKMRIYLVENRLYQIMVLGEGPIFSAKEKDVGIFLNSFRLNK
jgi:hypothetical protein